MLPPIVTQPAAPAEAPIPLSMPSPAFSTGRLQLMVSETAFPTVALKSVMPRNPIAGLALGVTVTTLLDGPSPST
jgi:hypothetical protein